eukprot:CAMPEP_0172174484 /NCGR_PEP_ID=MMETSP1050-20130122/13693_1 /TAXON_ID=233186 /ORGANISM="Cryptomonas curvata, Strain CCAP979/52" /LENGTH=202 /DNA_ID=CAMNT_0012846471 /DNA_START=179 /DNA_END=783 /DNA_ORIENTATION=+
MVKWWKNRVLNFKKNSVPRLDDMVLSFCMASSPRAGVGSDASSLLPEIRRLIYEHVRVFYVKEVSDTLSGLTLAESYGEALRQGLRSAWVGSKLQVPAGVYALVAPIILEKDLEIEGVCSKDTIIFNCVPIRHCVQVRGESHATTVSIVGITLQQRRVSESIDFTDGCHGGVCIDAAVAGWRWGCASSCPSARSASAPSAPR